MDLEITLDVQNRCAVVSTLSTERIAGWTVFQGGSPNIKLQLVKPNPSGGNAAPYTVQTTAGLSLIVTVGDPAGNGTILTQQTIWTNAANTFSGKLSFNTSAIDTWIGTLTTRDSYIEFVVSDGISPDYICRLNVTILAKIYDSLLPPDITGDVVLIDDEDSPYAVPSSVGIILADSSAGAIHIDLPAAPVENRRITIKDCGAAATYNITIDSGAVLIEGSATKVLSVNYEFVTLIYANSTWLIIGQTGSSAGAIVVIDENNPAQTWRLGCDNGQTTWTPL